MARKTSSAAGATRTKGATTSAATKPAAKKPRASNSVAAETAAKSDTPKASRPKKSSAMKSAVATKSSAPKSTATKSSAPKSPALKSSAPKSSAPKSTATKSSATKSAVAAARPVGRPKKVVPVIKLNDRQREFLTRIKGEEDKGGYHVEKKIEMRTLDALRERKLVKRGAKDKEKGTHPWTLTKLGEKTLTSATEAAQPGA